MNFRDISRESSVVRECAYYQIKEDFVEGKLMGNPETEVRYFSRLDTRVVAGWWVGAVVRLGRGSMCDRLVSNTARLDCNSVPLFISCPQDDDQRDGTTLCDVVTSKHRHRVCILIRKMVKLFSRLQLIPGPFCKSLNSAPGWAQNAP